MKMNFSYTSLLMTRFKKAHENSPRPAGACALLLALAWTVASASVQAAQADTAAPTQSTGAFWQTTSAGVVSDPLVAKGASVSRTANSTANSTASDASGNSTGRRGGASVRPRRYHATTLDRAGMRRLAATAPHERSQEAKRAPLVISLPHPDGGFQRFAIVESPVMEAELAAAHPEIKTFSGRGIDDRGATVRMDITPLGLHASVRTPSGAWYVDPYFHLDDSVYASYHSRDLPNPHGVLKEGLIDEAQIVLSSSFFHADDPVVVRGIGFTPNASVSVTVRNPASDFGPIHNLVASADQNGVLSVTLVADPTRSTGTYEVKATDGVSAASVSYQVKEQTMSITATAGTQLRTYRLALLTDPTYATYFGGAANVTAAKVTLINRVTQVYEDETSIRLVLINSTDKLNLNTAAQMTGLNGPCGGSACFSASQAAACASSTLSRNRVVIGLLAGASNFDIGHIALGLNGGGIASLGVVGTSAKAQGCTGIPTPVGDYYAVDYVAHEMGHQFAGNHTFNGITANCATSNRNALTSVEPGSGSSIMAYAGICGTDDLQTHSDAYWSQRSFDEITAYTSGAEGSFNEVQMGALTGFGTSGQSFQLKYNGQTSAAIFLGTGSNYTVAGIKAAIEAIAGWPAGGTVTVSSVGNTAFTVTFGGTLAGTSASQLVLVNCTGTVACSGYVGQITKGGPSTRRGVVTATGNLAPVVTTAASYTIPVRTPFTLTGSATAAGDDALTFMWEQNDRGSATGTGLISNTKLNGPLFRQFGVQAVVSASDTLLYGSSGENVTTASPTRTFPDMAQVLANNTNAATGSCPTAAATPSAADIACYSEFLPTASYVGFTGVNASPASLNFRLTARNGHGGIGGSTTSLVLAPGAGPFLVTSPNSAVAFNAGAAQTITWNVANTNIAPVSTANVKISLSLDGGTTFPRILAASVPNTGSASVVLPLLASTTARIKVEAIGNVFFDVSDANFTLHMIGDLNGDGLVNCADLAIVKAAMGKRTGQAGFDARADLNHDGVIDIRDLSMVAQRIAAGTVCR